MRLLAINVAVTLLLLGLIEGAVRMLVPEIGPVGTDRRLFADRVYGDTPGLRPGAAGESNGAWFEVDEHGFWRYATPGTDGQPAWLLLGDSVTMGMGVQPDSTFAGRLAAQQDAYRILNPSLIGYASGDYVRLLDALTDPAAPTYRPDVRRVTILWCLNDAYGAADAADDPGTAVRSLGGPFLTWIRRHLRTYHWLKATFLDRPRAYFDHDRRLYVGPTLEAAAADLGRVDALCRQRRLACDVTLLPYAFQLRGGAPASRFRPQRRLLQRIDTLGLTVHDPARYLFRRADATEALYLYGDGIHFSPLGHDLLADYLLQTLP